MLEVTPFRALRYDFSRFPDVSDLIAPPYDVLDQTDKDTLLARSEYNVVAIDLPHLPPKSLGPAQGYEKSARLLREWRRAGVLVREAQPALYLYHQTFEHEGKTHARKKFIARVRLYPFSEGRVLPHEETFGGPKADRLALTQATSCNLSPIFGLYTDPRGAIESAFASTAERAPDAVGTLEGVENRLWIVSDAAVIDRVCSEMATKKVFIADGHHRYGTALNYRDELARRGGEDLPGNHPANYVMFVLASMDDPGCLILPYHRALKNIDVATLERAWEGLAERCEPDRADLTLEDGAGHVATLRFTRRERLAELEPNKSAGWRELDVAYLHRVLIEEGLRGRDDPAVVYVKSAQAARETARRENGVALLLNATPMAHLRDVSEAGELMPQKSTYFYPKLVTGLTLNPLEEE